MACALPVTSRTRSAQRPLVSRSTSGRACSAVMGRVCVAPSRRAVSNLDALYPEPDLPHDPRRGIAEAHGILDSGIGAGTACEIPREREELRAGADEGAFGLQQHLSWSGRAEFC